REMPLGEPAADQLAERSETLRRRKLSGEVDPGHLGMDAAEQVPDGAPDRAGGRRGQVDDNGVEGGLAHAGVAGRPQGADLSGDRGEDETVEERSCGFRHGLWSQEFGGGGATSYPPGRCESLTAVPVRPSTGVQIVRAVRALGGGDWAAVAGLSCVPCLLKVTRPC